LSDDKEISFVEWVKRGNQTLAVPTHPDYSDRSDRFWEQIQRSNNYRKYSDYIFNWGWEREDT
jgi:hypothetical protein